MLTVPLIFLGAAFCLGWAYALGRICLRRLPAPWEAALAIGAALQSSLVFVLLCAGAASLAAFLGLGAVSFAVAWRFHGPTLKEPPAEPASRAVRILCAGIAGVYGVFYAVNALAPELYGDAATYHLGFAAEYVRTGAFPDRVGFYEMVPQGMELLFTVAFAIGRHSAAKLVHFGFLLASVPLIVRIGRRLGLSDTASLCAAGFYFCTPIAGICGASAYTDAAMVFFVLVAFYLLLVWHAQRDDRYLLPLGVAAGFCYAIKFSGLMILPLAMLIVLVHARRARPVLFLAAGLVMIAPWMIRDALMTGNPVAPLFNRWFPNPWFRAGTDELLANMMRSYGVPRSRIPAELAVGGKFGGVYGPLLFALPVGLLALRHRAGRWCWLAAAALAVPWLGNNAARFLMPTVVLASLAMMMAVPRAAVLLLVLQAFTCWPQVFELYNPSHIFRLEQLPWRAALRLESEDAYLMRESERYPVARMIQTKTAPGEKVFALTWVPWTYTDRFVLEYWHSGQGDRMLDWLKAASLHNHAPDYTATAAWPAQPLRALRFRLRAGHSYSWDIHEIRLWSGGERIRNRPQWTLSGWPDEWDMPAAFDENPATFWRTSILMQTGMYVQVDLDRPQPVSGVTVIGHGLPIEFYGMVPGGKWRSFGVGTLAPKVVEDVRRAATRAIRREGFQYILASMDTQGLGPLSRTFDSHETEWGLEKVDFAGETYLYRIK